MRGLRYWMLSAFLLATMAGAGLFIGKASGQAPPTRGQERRAERSYWRHHAGHWSYFDAPDKRWYYTNGTHWFYNTGNNNWQVYRFDKTFGRNGFERGEYVVPTTGVDVVLPNHEIYVAPR